MNKHTSSNGVINSGNIAVLLFTATFRTNKLDYFADLKMPIIIM